MSEIDKASQEAAEAARQAEQIALVLAVLRSSEAARPQPVCQHVPAAPQGGQATKWIAAAVGGAVLLLAVAVSAAIAVAAGVGMPRSVSAYAPSVPNIVRAASIKARSARACFSTRS